MQELEDSNSSLTYDQSIMKESQRSSSNVNSIELESGSENSTMTNMNHKLRKQATQSKKLGTTPGTNTDPSDPCEVSNNK